MRPLGTMGRFPSCHLFTVEVFSFDPIGAVKICFSKNKEERRDKTEKLKRKSQEMGCVESIEDEEISTLKRKLREKKDSQEYHGLGLEPIDGRDIEKVLQTAGVKVLLICRHARAKHNERKLDERYDGLRKGKGDDDLFDAALVEEGYREINDLKKKWKEPLSKVNIVVTSTLRRALQTAHEIVRQEDMYVKVEDYRRVIRY